MAFPSSGATDDLDTAWRNVLGNAAAIKRESQRLRNDSAASDVEGTRIVQYVGMLANARDSLARYAAVPGLAAYAQQQLNNPGLDIVAEYSAMLAQIDATRAWIVANFPSDGTYLLYHSFNAQGRVAHRMFAPAVLAGLRNALDALIATIA